MSSGGKVPLICQQCSASLLRWPSQIQGQVFCSTACRVLYRHAHQAEIFWQHVAKTETCWLWHGATDLDGYGRIGSNYGLARAPRLAWELTYGPIPDGFEVCHGCDTPPCVNPAHLWLGRTLANVHDAIRKKRRAIGARHPRASVTEEMAACILALKGIKTPSEIAKAYGVSRYVASSIHLGRTWKHLRADSEA